MLENPPDLLTETILGINKKRRKDLLPWWIKFFSWVFIVLAGIVILNLGLALFGASYKLSLYGLEISGKFSLAGILITCLYVFKGICAYGLLKEMDWAIITGIADALAGLFICTCITLFSFIDNGMEFTFRLELLFLALYLYKLIVIKPEWDNRIQV